MDMDLVPIGRVMGLGAPYSVVGGLSRSNGRCWVQGWRHGGAISMVPTHIDYELSSARFSELQSILTHYDKNIDFKYMSAACEFQNYNNNLFI